MVWTLILSIFLGLQTPAWAADSLYQELTHTKDVSVFVEPPTDPSQTKLDTESFRKQIERALHERKSIHFVPAASGADSRLVVQAEIKGFTFSETDPVDMLVGAAAIALDAAKVEHFASIEADFTVREAGRVRWSDRVRATITDEKMTEPESRTRILERAAHVFVTQAFRKKK